MRISEIFYSLQGEGFLAGVPATFVRLAGCPLRCRWCDTKYGWDESAAAHYTIDKIVKTVQEMPTRFVVVTGGEPMINADLTQKSDLPKLIQNLKKAEKHITIETAGISFVPDLPCDLMSISPKLSNSIPEDAEYIEAHQDARLDSAVLQELLANYNYQLKFIVDSQDDLPEIQQVIEEIGNIDLEKVMLMPQAATREEYLLKSPMVAELCRQTGFAFSPRLHLMLWDNTRQT
jgi:7-carboxy-7-deazaguanine synthase